MENVIEVKVAEAIENEKRFLSPEEIEAGKHHVGAYMNASEYAKDAGLNPDKFLAEVTRVTGVSYLTPAVKEATEMWLWERSVWSD